MSAAAWPDGAATLPPGPCQPAAVPSWDDVRRLVAALPDTDEHPSYGGRPSWRVRSRAFVWERTLTARDRDALGDGAPGQDEPLLGVRVDDEGVKAALLAAEPGVFTIPHLDGHPVVLVRLEGIGLAELAELVEDAWRARAPKRLLAPRCDAAAPGAAREQVLAGCAARPEALVSHPFGEDTAVFKVGGRTFALVDLGAGHGSVTLKADPGYAATLVQQHRHVTPGYHMDKRRWVTVDLAGGPGALPVGLVTELVEESYDLVVSGLPVRLRPGRSA